MTFLELSQHLNTASNFILNSINMQLVSCFSDFVSNIRPTSEELIEFREAHKKLRENLQNFDELSNIVITTFLQGSYRRATAIKPRAGKRGDIDIVVVTNIDKEKVNPKEALNLFIPFVEKYYKNEYEIQGRSIGIKQKTVDLDLVITSAPSEVNKNFFNTTTFTKDYTLEDTDVFNFAKSSRETWSLSPLDIPDRDAMKWQQTNPLAQIQATQAKNTNCNGHFVNIVKAIKWWRKEFSIPKYPKGYPVEHLIWDCCPDDVETIAQGVTKTLEQIVQRYPTKPQLFDHGLPQIPEHDVLKRVTDEDYAKFYEKICDAASLARRALDEEDTDKSVKLWQNLFGEEFPNCEGTAHKSETTGYSRRTQPSNLGNARFG